MAPRGHRLQWASSKKKKKKMAAGLAPSLSSPPPRRRSFSMILRAAPGRAGRGWVGGEVGGACRESEGGVDALTSDVSSIAWAARCTPGKRKPALGAASPRSASAAAAVLAAVRERASRKAEIPGGRGGRRGGGAGASQAVAETPNSVAWGGAETAAKTVPPFPEQRRVSE